MPDSEATTRAVEFVFKKLNSSGYDSLNPAQRSLVCAWAVCGEIDNGGIWQFFFNTSGDWAVDTPEALRAVSAPELASVVEAAIAEFSDDGPSRDLDTRRAQIKGLPKVSTDVWDDLDRKFDSSEIAGKLDAFVAASQDSLYEDGYA